MTKLKVCCIASEAEAELAINQGADALGLVSAMPSGPGVIEEELIARIAARVPAPVDSFLLTCEAEAAAIVAQLRRCGTTTVQLVDAVAPSAYAAIRRALPDRRIVQVVHVEDESALAQSRAAAEQVDALLLDSGRPSLAVKQLGGTGRVHDWSLSRRIVESVSVPVFLAGGIRPDNVGQAIAAVRPYGIDLCSGVRTEGRLDPAKLGALVAAMAAA
ncbi:MAG: phosphoribosylanthranilate isomerase [Kiloniellales bacterium]|nr:phosphoribosylanthranilate isomerase [Kiloniellales bacterium]